MELPLAAVPPDLEATLVAERARLVRLCTRLSGSPEAAEDLAQEALVEAWRNAHKLRDPEGLTPWLAAIARHVCLRWARRRGREGSRFAAPLDEADAEVADRFDLEFELERDELARLLDRALALLPADTRAVLVARYVEEAPQVEVALRMGLSEGAVAMRLRRGKLALRRLLACELRDEAAEYGASEAADGRWEDTQIWCPVCGRHRLRGRLVRATGELTVRCPGCNREPGSYISQAVMPHLHRQSGSAAAGVSRLLDWLGNRYWPEAPEGLVRCVRCARPVVARLVPFAEYPFAPQVRYAVATACAECGHRDLIWLNTLLLSLPVARRFWREQRRVRFLAEREVEAGGHPAVVLGFESVGSAARCEVVASLDTFAVLGLHAPGAG